MTDDIDFGKVVDLALRFQLMAERHVDAHRRLASEAAVQALTPSDNPRAAALDAIVNAGVPETYARKAMNVLYPTAAALREFEKRHGIVTTQGVIQTLQTQAEIASTVAFVTDLKTRFDVEYPDMKILVSVYGSWRNRVFNHFPFSFLNDGPSHYVTRSWCPLRSEDLPFLGNTRYWTRIGSGGSHYTTDGPFELRIPRKYDPDVKLEFGGKDTPKNKGTITFNRPDLVVPIAETVEAHHQTVEVKLIRNYL